MYSQRFGIVQREIRGPTPKVVVLVSSGNCLVVLLSPEGRLLGSQWGWWWSEFSK